MAAERINSVLVEEEEDMEEIMFIEEIQEIAAEVVVMKKILVLGKLGSVCYRSQFLDAYPTCAFTFLGYTNVDALMRAAHELCPENTYDMVIYAGMHDKVLKQVDGEHVYKMSEEMRDICVTVEYLINYLANHFRPDKIIILWPLSINLVLFNRMTDQTQQQVEVLNVRSVAGALMIQETLRHLQVSSPATYVPVDTMSKFRRRSRVDRHNDAVCSARLIEVFHETLHFPRPV